MLDDIIERLKALEARSTLRQGVVTATSPLTVAVGGSAVPYTDCQRFDGYTPVVGDTVRVELTGGPALIHGKII